MLLSNPDPTRRSRSPGSYRVWLGFPPGVATGSPAPLLTLNNSNFCAMPQWISCIHGSEERTISYTL